MQGRIPIARINDQNYRVGDTVAELFTITRIDGTSVSGRRCRVRS